MAKQPHLLTKFKIAEDGIYCQMGTDEPAHIAPYVIKKANVIAANGSWFTQFEFRTERGELKTVDVPRSEAKKIHKLRELFANLGFNWPETKSAEEDMLKEYLSQNPVHYVELVSKTGWFKQRTFVFQDTAIGPDAKTVKYRDLGEVAVEPGCKGDLLTWKKTISRIVPHSNSAMLALGTAFGAPFHEFLRIESGGFNLFGAKSKGKTTAAVAAQSVYCKSGREHVTTWDATEAGLDEMRCEYADMVIYLDDMGRAGKTDDIRIAKIGDAVFRLTTGKSRRRAKGFKVDQNHPSTWGAILSSSVRSMLAISKAVGSHIFGGEEVRLIDVPAVASLELGIFETCPKGSKSSRSASYKLESVCSKHYGVAGREYISQIVRDREEAVTFVKERVEAFVTALGADGDSEGRYVQRFGLAYAGLKLAAKYGVISLPKNAAWKSIRGCYARARASSPSFPQMVNDAVEGLTRSLPEHDAIIDLSRPGRKTTQGKFDACSGVILAHADGKIMYCVKHEELGRLSCSSLPAKQIVDELKARRMLLLVKGGKSTVPVTVPGLGTKNRQRLVCIRQAAIQSRADTD